MAKRQMTNEEKVLHMLNFSRHGAIKQVFMMEALRKYAEQVKATGAEAMETPFISGAAWVAVADEVIADLDTKMTVEDNDEEEAA